MKAEFLEKYKTYRNINSALMKESKLIHYIYKILLK